MDWRYEYVRASPSSSGASTSRAPSPVARTGTGVASATPVTSTAPASTRVAARLPLPDTLRLIEVDRPGVEGQGRPDRRGRERQLLRGRVDQLEVALVVEHRLQDGLRERGIELRVDHEQVLDAGHRGLGHVLVRPSRDLHRHVERAVLVGHLLYG